MPEKNPVWREVYGCKTPGQKEGLLGYYSSAVPRRSGGVGVLSGGSNHADAGSVRQTPASGWGAWDPAQFQRGSVPHGSSSHSMSFLLTELPR